MLSEAKHLNFSNRAIQKRSEILRFAQNDIGRWIVILVSLVKEKRMPIRAKYVHTNLIARDWKIGWSNFIGRYSDANPKRPNTCTLI